MKVVYFGSDNFSADILNSLFDSEHVLVGIVTTPDVKKGRGQFLAKSPLKKIAEEKNIVCMQPVDLCEPLFLAELRDLNADIFVVVSYGKILPKVILGLPGFSCINVHPSLLPKYRGPSPVNYTLLNGDKYAGVTFIKLNEEIDAGDIYFQEEILIDYDINAEELLFKLGEIAGGHLAEILTAIENDSVHAVSQDNSTKSYAPLLTKNMGRINWSLSAVEIHNRVRALVPWPVAFSYFSDKYVKIYHSAADDKLNISDDITPGTIVDVSKENGIGIKCGKGVLYLIEIQMEGKKRMKAFDWANGRHLQKGEYFV